MSPAGRRRCIDHVKDRLGMVDQTDLVKPAANVYMQSRIASTPIDPALKAFDKMPG